MNTESDDRFVELLSRILRDTRDLQRAGRLQDPVSRTEVALLDHQLGVMQARVAATTVPGPAGGAERVEAVAAWARAVSAASVAARGHSRRVRKDLYRTRMSIGASP